jgi:alpha-tubulin suppressor-like RCC1 family protein
VAVIGGLFFSQVSAGGGHTCGRTPGGVAYCWGYGGNGALGSGTTENSSTPVPVSDPM